KSERPGPGHGHGPERPKRTLTPPLDHPLRLKDCRAIRPSIGQQGTIIGAQRHRLGTKFSLGDRLGRACAGRERCPGPISSSATLRASSTCLRVECTKCARKGRYSVHKLIEKYGRKANMMKLERTAKRRLPEARGTQHAPALRSDLPRSAEGVMRIFAQTCAIMGA